jgi:N-acetyl-gamma-glutamyl-phosphate reductase
MVVEVPLPLYAMQGAGSPEALRAALVDFYAGSPVVSVNTDDTPAELLLRRSTAPSDKLELFVFGGMEVRRRVWSPCSTIWARVPAVPPCRA